MDTAGEGLLMVIAVSGAGNATGALGAGLAALAATAGGAAALAGAAGRAAGPAHAAWAASKLASATNRSRIFTVASPVTARLHGHGDAVQRGAVVPQDPALV